MSAVFVTATGTDVGKTFFTALLIRHYRAIGRAVDALKPVVTGFDPTTAETSDPGVLLTALGRSVTPDEIERIAPWRYAIPVAPDFAAKRENRRVDFDALVRFSQQAIAASRDMLLIEGVGGVMSPLNDTHTVLDWMIALQIPVVLIAGTYLGAISHTLTCLEVLSSRKLKIKLVIVNDTPGSPVTKFSTTESITNFVQSIPVVSFGRLPADAQMGGAFAAMAESL